MSPPPGLVASKLVQQRPNGSRGDFARATRGGNHPCLEGVEALSVNCLKSLINHSLCLLACLAPVPLRAGTDSNTLSEARFLVHTRQLTFEGRRSGEGYFSPDGKALIFQSEREPGNPFYQIYLLDLETGDSHRASTGTGKTTCAFFRPSSDEVIFASSHLDPDAKAKQKAEFELRASGKERRYAWDYDENMDIFIAKRDGSNLRRLTSVPGYDAEAS